MVVIITTVLLLVFRRWWVALIPLLGWISLFAYVEDASTSWLVAMASAESMNG